CRAGEIRKLLTLLVTITAHVEDDAADGIGAARAIIEKLIKRFISRDALILLERIDQIDERLDWNLMFRDRLGQRREQPRLHLPGVRLSRLIAQEFQLRDGDLSVVNFISQIIRGSTKRVDVTEIL